MLQYLELREDLSNTEKKTQFAMLNFQPHNMSVNIIVNYIWRIQNSFRLLAQDHVRPLTTI